MGDLHSCLSRRCRFQGTAQNRRRGAADDDAWGRMLKRAWISLNVLEGNEAPMICRLLLAPDGLHGFQVLSVRAPRSLKEAPNTIRARPLSPARVPASP